jgi:hypothetical protein
MRPRKPPPLFEVCFEGPGIYPEKIPLRSLVTTLSAVQRLAAGTTPVEDDETDEEQEPDAEESLRLLYVKRGSAIFQISAPTAPDPRAALKRLRVVGDFLENHENDVEDIDYALSPIKDLSTAARSLDCKITLREAGPPMRNLAIFEPTSYEMISKLLLVEGETSFVGKVQRVGGATDVRCGLRVSFQSRMLICRISDRNVARTIGKRLYEDVVVHGTAKWLKNTWKMVSFTINAVNQPAQGSLLKAFDELREAGGKSWDAITDPAAFLREVSGER